MYSCRRPSSSSLVNDCTDSAMWFSVCGWWHEHFSDDAIHCLCKLAVHWSWSVRNRFIVDSNWRRRSNCVSKCVFLCRKSTVILEADCSNLNQTSISLAALKLCLRVVPQWNSLLMSWTMRYKYTLIGPTLRRRLPILWGWSRPTQHALTLSQTVAILLSQWNKVLTWPTLPTLL